MNDKVKKNWEIMADLLAISVDKRSAFNHGVMFRNPDDNNPFKQASFHFYGDLFVINGSMTIGESNALKQTCAKHNITISAGNKTGTSYKFKFAETLDDEALKEAYNKDSEHKRKLSKPVPNWEAWIGSRSKYIS